MPLAQSENCAVPNKKLFGPMVCHMSLSKTLVWYKNVHNVPTYQVYQVVFVLTQVSFVYYGLCKYYISQLAIILAIQLFCAEATDIQYLRTLTTALP